VILLVLLLPNFLKNHFITPLPFFNIPLLLRFQARPNILILGFRVCLKNGPDHLEATVGFLGGVEDGGVDGVGRLEGGEGVLVGCLEEEGVGLEGGQRIPQTIVQMNNLHKRAIAEPSARASVQSRRHGRDGVGRGKGGGRREEGGGRREGRTYAPKNDGAGAGSV